LVLSISEVTEAKDENSREILKFISVVLEVVILEIIELRIVPAPRTKIPAAVEITGQR
jgi:hypothetical protein